MTNLTTKQKTPNEEMLELSDRLAKNHAMLTHSPTEPISDYKYKCDCVCHLVVPDELNNCDCIRFHTSLSEHDLELIREGRAMSDFDTRRGV